MIRPIGIPDHLDVMLDKNGKPGTRTFYHDFPAEPGRRMSVAVFEDSEEVQARVRQLADETEKQAEQVLRMGGSIRMWPDKFVEQAVAERAGQAINAELAKLDR